MFSSKKFFPLFLITLLLVSSAIFAAPRHKVAVPVPEVPVPAVISDIEISGDYYTPKSTVMDALDLKVGDPMDEGRIREAIQQIGSMGVYSQVDYRTEKTPSGSRVIFLVKERPRIGSIKIEGNHALTSDDIEHRLNSHDKTLVDLPKIRQDIATINALYATKGFLDCKVIGVEYPEEDGDALTFRVAEKNLTEIRITGNRSTKPYVILREFESKLGEPVNSITLKEDLRRVFNLNYFSKLDPRFEEGRSPTSSILTLEVAEKRGGTFTFGGGYGAVSGFNLFTNFAWDNFFGMGQSVSLSGNFGLGGSGVGRSNTYEFKYSNPWMWDKRQSFTTQLWSRNGSVGGFNPLSGSSGLTYRDEISNGVQFGFGFPVSYAVRTQHNFKYESVRLVSANVNYTIQSYTFQISLDTRDVWFNPTKGTFDTFSVEKAFSMLASSLDYTRVDLDFRQFMQVVDKQVLAGHLALGYLNSGQIGDADRFAREYYRMGGANSVRGYDELNPFAYGNKQVLASLEYRFLLDDAFQVLLFVDAGYAPVFVNDLDHTQLENVDITTLSRYRVGKGVGTRITVPMLGAIRLDFGINDHGDSRLHFSIGQTF